MTKRLVKEKLREIRGESMNLMISYTIGILRFIPKNLRKKRISKIHYSLLVGY